MNRETIMKISQRELRQHLRSLRNAGLITYTTDSAKADLGLVINGTKTERGLDVSMPMLRKIAVEKQYPPTGGTAGYQDKDDPEPEEQAPVAVHQEAAKPSKEQKIQELLGSLGEILGEGNGSPQGVDKTAVQAIAESAANRVLDEKIKDGLPERVVVLKEGEIKRLKEDVTHCQLPEILAAMATGENVYLYGPSGTGKTVLARMVAKALDLDFYFTGKVDQEHSLMGFVDAKGGYVETPFYKSFTKGGLFLLDEIDASIPRALTRVNAALGNRFCDFPNGVKEAHKDFRILAAGNTNMSGATAEFNARQSFDSAIKERFPIFIHFDYDKAMERRIASQWKDGEKVALRVQAVRKAVETLKVRHTVTMRATEAICKLVAGGMEMKRAEEIALWKGQITKQTIAKVEAEVAKG